jgi:hypothetical protein
MRHALRISGFALLALVASAQSQREQKEVEALHATNGTFRGVLIDAGCRDRSLWNINRPPESQAAAAAPFSNGTVGAQATQASGISVDSKTMDAERSDVTQVMTINDLSARQSDPTCAIKANTRAYAVLLSDGRLLDLDEGGNTYATAAVQGSPQGRAMMNGRGPGFKPAVTVMGRVHGDRIFADQVKLGR